MWLNASRCFVLWKRKRGFGVMSNGAWLNL